MVNSVIPKAIKVKRGVRQGDPMSCLLYNLAIEPLAYAIRGSKELKGYKANRMKRLITKLFVDDTLVYLNKQDKTKDLEKIIKEFYIVSTAKFNLEKTEVLPIGSLQYRKDLVETRQMGDGGNKIPTCIKLIKDGELMRTLGFWVGNSISIKGKWKEMMERWSKVEYPLKEKNLYSK